MRRKKISGMIIMLLLFTILAPYFSLASAETTLPDIEIDFGGTKREGVSYLPTSTVSGKTVSFASGKEVESWEVVVNGVSLGKVGTLSGNTLTLPTITGRAHQVAMYSEKNPGHMIWRNSAGTIWQTTGETVGTYYVTGDCIEGGISECPGNFPSSLPDELEHNGMAVTTAYRVEPPISYKIDPDNINDASVLSIPSSAVDPLSIKIVPEKSVPITEGVVVIGGGKGDIVGGVQYGKIQVAKFLNKDYNVEGLDYTFITPGSPVTGHAQGRNYEMKAKLYFEAITYVYSGKVKVKYKEPVDPCVANPNAPGCQPEPSQPPSYKVTGYFDILPANTIDWRDPFQLKPKDFQIPEQCAYLYHEYRIIKDGIIWQSDKITSQTTITSFSYSTYPYSLGIGSNLITIRVTANCDTVGQIDSGWMSDQYLNINSPSNNRPPQFSAGFFKEYNRNGITPDYEVVVNSRVNLRIINDPTKEPPLPHDPDGDPIFYTWLFQDSNSAWIRSLPGEYGFYNDEEGYYNILASELGYHSIKVIARDSFGAESTRTVSINVIPENPIPLIDGPTEVKENRPLPLPFDGSRSYSPAGYTIQEYIWENKKDKYTAPGTETIKLDVMDSKGLKSLAPAIHMLTVLPDDPPIGVLEVPPLGIRDELFEIFDKSYSSDGDKIASVVYRYKYDADNDGFENDSWQSVSGSIEKLDFQPEKVGKYVFDIYVCEEYGKCAYASDTQPESSRIMDVVNQAPSVSFLIEGKNEEPEPPGKDVIPASTILNTWALFDVNSSTPLTKKPHMWTTDNGKLLAGLGKGMEKQYSYLKSMSYGMGAYEIYTLYAMLIDNGLGPNSISPYRGLAERDPQRSGPVLLPRKSSGGPFTTGEDYDSLNPAQNPNFIRTNEQYIYFDQSVSEYYGNDRYANTQYIFALNKNKIPRQRTEDWFEGDSWSYKYELRYVWDDPNPYDFIAKIPAYGDGELPYFYYNDVRVPGWREKAETGDFSGASMKLKGTFMGHVGTEISGSRIYAVYFGGKAKYAYLDDEYDLSWAFDWSEGNHLEVHIYDAFTGEFLGKNQQKVTIPYSTYGFHLSLNGENVVVRLHDSAMPKYWEFDRSGKLVASGQMQLSPINITYALKAQNYFGQIYELEPANYSCQYSIGYVNWKDDRGNQYAYATNKCYHNGSEVSYQYNLNPDFPAGVYLVQIKPDHSIGWASKLPGNVLNKPITGMYDINIESGPLVGVNPATGKIHTRTWTSVYCNGCMFPQVTQHNSLVDINTGAVTNTNYSMLIKLDNINYGFHMTWQGAYGSGWRSQSASGTLDKFNFYPGKLMMKRGNNAGVNTRSTTSLRFGEYVGDGMWLSMYGGDFADGGPGWSNGGLSSETWMFLDVGTPHSTQAFKGFQIGQFVSPDSYTNAEYSFRMSMDTPAADTSELAGMSFHMTDPRNRYALETDGTTLFLSKYVNGARTVLDSIAYPFQPRTQYTFRIKAQDNLIQVWLNNVPYFDVTDDTFAAGKFGPFSDKSYVTFGDISQKEISDENVRWLTSYAIWENGSAQAEVRYSNIIFDDPEKDPRAGDNQWSIQHTPKFLNNQGLSALHEQTMTSPALKFDKVGNYRVTLKARDDPHPNYLYPSEVFADYRKWSNEYWQIITVHRRPIAQFTLSVDPEDHTVIWDDQSYDPDRWESDTVYDTEPTGIDYRATRGITERRYYYMTPSGEMVDRKLVAPQEAGTYTVGLQVKDDFGAWSYWTEHEITVIQPAAKDEPPVPGFTLSKTTLYRGENLTIVSEAWDKEDGPAENLPHEYYIRNVTEGSAETLQSTSRGTWDKTFNTVGVMEIRQVVHDSAGQSAQLIQQVTVLNRPPAANFDWMPKPVYEGDTISITNMSSDPDGDSLTYAWSVQGPNGYTQTGSTKHIAIDGGSTLNRPGIYQVTLRVRDVYGAEASAARNITVHELSIQGYVLHTDDWEENRQRYNAKNPKSARPSDWFWAGEAFRLAADVTDTGNSATKPVSVAAEASPELRKDLAQAGPDLVRWEGLLRSADAGFPLEELPQGPYTFLFTVHYSNGAVKTSAVTIQIRNTVHNYVQVHRLQ